MKTKKGLSVDNRAASPFPEISVANYRNIAPEFECYFADRFGKRKRYVKIWNKLFLYVFRESPNEQILLGNDGYCFLASHTAGKENRNSLFFTLLKYDSAEVHKTAEYLLSYRNVFPETVVPVLFAAVPTKHSLNFDKVPATLRQQLAGNPAGIPVYTAVTRELSASDKAFTEKFFLDLYPDALELNRKIQLIPQKSFHWLPGPYTHFAAHRIAERFGVTKESFTFDEKEYCFGDVESDFLTALLDLEISSLSWHYTETKCPVRRIPLYKIFSGINYPESVFRDDQEFYAANPSAAGGKILAVGDSFTPPLCQDLARYFKEAAVMDYSAVWRYLGNERAKAHFLDVFRTYKPDCIVFVSHGGYLFPDIAAGLKQGL